MTGQRSVVVLTGAGISADSGLSVFRGAGGLWAGLPIEEVATPEAWRANPERVWSFYQQRRAALREVAPNPAHLALAGLEQRLAAAGVAFTLITQNVDDLHERAGSSAPLHMHGQLAVLRCEVCGMRRPDLEFLEEERFLPCPSCAGARLRPDVVWFGEVPYHLETIERELARCTDFLALGTSGVVYPAAGLLALARAAGARTWVQSLERPENLCPADHFVPGRAAEVLPELLERLEGSWLAG